MSNLSGFNANDVPESTFGPMPVGLYAVMATASEVKATKAGTGQYLQFTLDVLDEQYNNKKLWVRLNLWNPNQTAVTIAQQELAALCKAVNVLTPDDSSELCGIPFVARVGIEQDKATGKEQNTVLNFYSTAAANELAAKENEKTAQAAATNPAASKPAAAPKAGPVWPGAPR